MTPASDRRLLELLGEKPACGELLAFWLKWPEPERAALIGGLYASARGQALAEVLADVESDPDDPVRLRLIGALREVPGASSSGRPSPR